MLVGEYIGSCSKCTGECLSNTQDCFKTGYHKLRGSHQILNAKAFRQQLKDIVNYSQSQQVWAQVEIKINLTFDKIEKYFQQLKAKALSETKQVKLAVILGTNDKKTLKKAEQIINGNFKLLKCNDICQISVLIDSFIPMSSEKIKTEAQQFCDSFISAWKTFNKALTLDVGCQINPLILLSKSPIYQADKQESIVFDVKLKPQFGFMHMHSEKSANQIGGKNFLKIKQIDQQGQNLANFDTVLKITKIKKKFKIGMHNRVQYQAGDHTGIATVVSNDSVYIKEGNVVELNDCKIYMFKDKIKQIQPSSKTMVKPSRYQIKGVNLSNNISDIGPSLKYQMDRRQVREQPRYRRDEPRRPRQQQEDIFQKFRQEKNGDLQGAFSKKQGLQEGIRTTKIEDIQPGDQGINIIAQVTTVDEIQHGKIECLLGDLTGVVKARLPELKFIKEGVAIMIYNIDAQVESGHIKIKDNKKTIVQIATIRFQRVNMSNNISQRQYQEIQNQQ